MTDFRVLLSNGDRRTYPDCPRTVPWSFVEPHREQAERNHDQTLERLNERGGLDPVELWAIVHKMNPFRRGGNAPSLADAITWLKEQLA